MPVAAPGLIPPPCLPPVFDGVLTVLVPVDPEPAGPAPSHQPPLTVWGITIKDKAKSIASVVFSEVLIVHLLGVEAGSLHNKARFLLRRAVAAHHPVDYRIAAPDGIFRKGVVDRILK